MAYEYGDTSRCRVVIRESPGSEYKAQDVVPIRKSMNLSQNALVNVLDVPVGRLTSGKLLCCAVWPSQTSLYLIEYDYSHAENEKAGQVSSDR